MLLQDVTRLRHIIDAGRTALTYASAVSRDDLAADDMRARAVVQTVCAIGGAGSGLAPELRARHPEVPWADVIDLRDRLVHGYDAIDYARVWDTVTGQVPTIIANAEAILAGRREEAA